MNLKHFPLAIDKMAASLPPVPASLKQIQHYLKTATEHDKRDTVVAYYCRLYAFQKGLELDKKSPEGRTFLMSLMDVMENEKQQLKDSEAITNEVVGQAHVENYALKLFLYADNEDRASRFGKNVVKSFYTAGMLFDVLGQFGEISEDVEKNKKYAKWKAAYIHNCLKNGETPHAGPLEEEDGLSEATGGGPPIGFPQPGTSGQPSYSQPGPGIPPQDPQASVPSAYTLPQVPPSQHYTPQPMIPAATPHQPAAIPQQPAAAPQRWNPPPNPGAVQLNAQDYQRAMKLCKYASSAMQYEDSKTAIDNLTKALNLLTTGNE